MKSWVSYSVDKEVKIQKNSIVGPRHLTALAVPMSNDKLGLKVRFFNVGSCTVRCSLRKY